MNNWIYGKNYRFTINSVYELTEERVKRGDWKSKVIGYRPGRIFLKDGERWIGQKMLNWKVFDSPADAIFETIKQARKMSSHIADIDD